jgi:hypothetical protein
MLLQLIFLAVSCISYAILGLIVLACVPTLRLTFLNLALFLVGAFAGGLGTLFLYGRAFMRDPLGDVAFYGVFPSLLIGGAIGGAISVWLKIRLVKGKSIEPPL